MCTEDSLHYDSATHSVEWMGHAPRKLQEHTVSVRALCTPCLPWFLVSQVSVLTYVQCSPVGLTLPLPCAHWASRVKQGKIHCAIFHVIHVPDIHHLPLNVGCVPHLMLGFLTHCRHSVLHCKNSDLDWFRHNNKFKHEDFPALCHLDNLCKQL